MGWKNYHLHAFFTQSFERCHVEEDECLPLFRMVEKTDGRFFYEYDFGDCWQHEIVLEKILTKPKRKKYPSCVAGNFACPPEDCGGIYGFRHLLEVMKKQRSREYHETVKWLGKPFDIGEFDVGKVNRHLQNRNF